MSGIVESPYYIALALWHALLLFNFASAIIINTLNAKVDVF
jgi:hypothetical protein